MDTQLRIWLTVGVVVLALAVGVCVAVSRRFRRLARRALPYAVALVCVVALEIVLYRTYQDIKIILLATAHLAVGGMLVWLLGRAFPPVQHPTPPPEDRPNT
jgi:hypothetical protein